jgi:Tol biopolymer transport system component
MAIAAALKRRRFRWSLRTMFVVVTIVACWMGWNLSIVRQRQSLSKEIIAEAQTRMRIMSDFHYGGAFIWEEKHLRRTKSIPKLTLLRRWLGDEDHSAWPILRSTEQDALRTAAIFPEADVRYYDGPRSSDPYSDMVEAIFHASPAIYMMNSDGSNFRLFVEWEGKWLGPPSFSPDGKSLMFDAWPLGSFGQGRIYVTALDSLNPHPSDLGPGAMPAWSPDGKLIAFSIYTTDPNQIPFGIWVMNADGTQRRRISDGRSPHWSPDCKRLSLVKDPDGKGEGLYVYDLENDQCKQIVEGTHSDIGAADWCGDRLTFIRRTSRDHELVIASLADGDGEMRVRLAGQLGWRARWSSDGRYIICTLAGEDGRTKLFRVEADTSREPELLAHQDKGRRNADGSWSPDGKQIVFTSNR